MEVQETVYFSNFAPRHAEARRAGSYVRQPPPSSEQHKEPIMSKPNTAHLEPSAVAQFSELIDAARIDPDVREPLVKLWTLDPNEAVAHVKKHIARRELAEATFAPSPASPPAPAAAPAKQAAAAPDPLSQLLNALPGDRKAAYQSYKASCGEMNPFARAKLGDTEGLVSQRQPEQSRFAHMEEQYKNAKPAEREAMRKAFRNDTMGVGTNPFAARKRKVQ